MKTIYLALGFAMILIGIMSLGSVLSHHKADPVYSGLITF